MKNLFSEGVELTLVRFALGLLDEKLNARINGLLAVDEKLGEILEGVLIKLENGFPLL